MKLDELERELVKLLKECSKLGFKEQIAFLLKKAEGVEDDDLKVVIFLYVNHLIQQYNVKGRSPFVLPPLQEIRQISSKFRERDADLRELVEEVPVETPKTSMSKDIYSSPEIQVVNPSKPAETLYSSSTYQTKYQDKAYRPTEPLDDYKKTVGVDKLPESGVERELRQEKTSTEKPLVDVGYKTQVEARKEADKKIYGV